MYSEMDHAKPKPSYVLVPLPNSSMITKEFWVAFFKMDAVSNISIMKVDTPFNWESPAPTRHNIASTTATVASSHGTKHPICAIKHITPICLIYVDLPPILGPVIIMNSDSSWTSFTSLQIKVTSSCISTIG